MDNTELTVRNMLKAIEAPAYDVGVLGDRGMLPGLDSIPAETLIQRLRLLKYRNARGSRIYIQPSGEHCYTILDDLSESSLARLTADRFTPCAIVETSAGNFQAWLKHPAVFPKLLGTFAAQTLATTPTRAQPTGAVSDGSPASPLQARAPQTGWPLPFRSSQREQWCAVPHS